LSRNTRDTKLSYDENPKSLSHDNDAASVEDLFRSANDKLFRQILHNSAHVLQLLIPDRQPSSYDLRPRSHDKLLLNKTTYLSERDFVIRMLYRDSY